MAFPVTALQLGALMGNHQMISTATLIRGGASLGQIPFRGGTATASLGIRGGRDAAILIDRGVAQQYAITPLTDQIILTTGIPAVVDVPIFTGRVDFLTDEQDGSVQVQLLSRSAEAIRAKFESPWPAITNTEARQEIRRILQDVDVTWAVDISGANMARISDKNVWEEDRGQAADDLARAANLIWQPDRTGGFVVFDNPYFVGTILADNPVLMLRDGVSGTVVNVHETTSRQGIYNSVTVVVERTDNSEPIRVTVRDSAPSPTAWGGPFGKQNVVVKTPIPRTTPDAAALAVRVLRQSLALTRSWSISVPHLPILDPGDVFLLWYQDVVTAQVVESISYSLDAKQATAISSRELVLAEFFTTIL